MTVTTAAHRDMHAHDLGLTLCEVMNWFASCMRAVLREREALDDVGLEEAKARLAELRVTLDTWGGNCPVQVEGTFDDVAFYFRARGAHWAFHVYPAGGDLFRDDIWEYDESYGTWPDAGWMPLGEALGFVATAVAKYREAHP